MAKLNQQSSKLKMIRLCGLLMFFFSYLLSSGGFVASHLQVSLGSSAALSHRRLASNARRQISQTLVKPPLAKKVRHEMNMFNDLRVDNYYWLRNDSRSDPQVLSYLEAENSYTERIMSGSKQLEDQIYEEIRGRIPEDDITLPIQSGGFCYYERIPKGKEYMQYCRRPITNGACSFEEDHDDSHEEHIYLDMNIKAQGHDYYSIGSIKASPNNKLVAYTEDTKGNEIYTAYIMDIDNGNLVGKPLKSVDSDIEWVGDDTILYTTSDETLRSDKVWSHNLLVDQSSDQCLYHEKDNKFYVSFYTSENKKYIFVRSSSRNTRSIFFLNMSRKENGLQTLAPRMHGINIHASHRGNHFFMRRRSEKLYNSELVACHVDNLNESIILLSHRESVEIQNFMLFSGHIVVFERENGLQKITVYDLPPIGEAIGPLHDGRAVDFIDSIYHVALRESQFYSSILRFEYSSLKTPQSVYDYDMVVGTSVLKKMDKIFGGFNTSNYMMERKWANASDGTQVPISIVYRKNLVKLDGLDPLLLYAYGSYGSSTDPSFVASRLPLLDRGGIFAIAHVRGGGEMGRKWYEDGRLLKKRNTFSDFIAAAEYLIKIKYSSKEKLCIYGGSAGGMLIGAVLNMRPDLFKVAVAVVPFVDVLTTMLDPTIPLTTVEFEDWGDPRNEEYYFYMKSYSPLDNIKSQNYPNILVTAGLYDSRVLYFEPTKYVAKLRATKANDNLLLFKCNLAAGHFSKSGRFESMRETAFIYTFIFKALGMT